MRTHLLSLLKQLQFEPNSSEKKQFMLKINKGDFYIRVFLAKIKKTSPFIKSWPENWPEN